MAASKGALIGRYESKGRNIPKFILNSVIGFVFAAVIVLFANFAVPMSIPVYVAITGVLTALIMVFLWRVVHKHPPAYEIYDGGGVLLNPNGSEKQSFDWTDVQDIHPVGYRPGVGVAAGAAGGGIVGAVVGAAVDEAVARSNTQIGVRSIDMKVSGKLVQFDPRYAQPGELVRQTVKAAMKVWQAEAIERLGRGDSVQFVKVTVTPNGVEYKNKFIPWVQIDAVEMVENAPGNFFVMRYRDEGSDRSKQMREPMGYRGHTLVGVIIEMRNRATQSA